jgi:oligopeptide transport system substrate-binding protein
MRLVRWLLPLCLIFSVTACRWSAPTSRPIHLNIFSDPRTLDPRLTDEIVGRNVALLLFEGLTRVGPDGKPQLAAASSVQVSPDGREYTFSLRPARWAGGLPVTAEDFVRTWQSILDPAFPSPFAYLLYVVENGQRIKGGELPPQALGVRAEDPQTLVIRLEHPAPYFLALLATPPFYAVPRTMERLPGGNGPFRAVAWTPDHQLILEKNPRYWDASAVCLDQIILEMVQNENTALLMFEKGELDYVGLPFCALPLDAISNLAATPTYHQEEVAAIYWYKINTTRPPLNHPKIRQALSLALNRPELCRYVTSEVHQPATGALPACLCHDRPSLLADNQRSEAVRLLAEGLRELGVVNASPRFLELAFNQGSDHLRIAASVAQVWEEVLGLHIELKLREWHDHLSHLRSGDYDIGRLAWQAHYPDPLDLLAPFANSPFLGGTNETGWDNAAYRALLEQARVEASEEKRLACLREAEEILLGEMPVVPLFSLRYVYCCAARLRGLVFSSLCTVDLRWAYCEPES